MFRSFCPKLIGSPSRSSSVRTKRNSGSRSNSNTKHVIAAVTYRCAIFFYADSKQALRTRNWCRSAFRSGSQALVADRIFLQLRTLPGPKPYRCPDLDSMDLLVPARQAGKSVRVARPFLSRLCNRTKPEHQYSGGAERFFLNNEGLQRPYLYSAGWTAVPPDVERIFRPYSCSEVIH